MSGSHESVHLVQETRLSGPVLNMTVIMGTADHDGIEALAIQM